jgi:hypothetical protein
MKVKLKLSNFEVDLEGETDNISGIENLSNINDDIKRDVTEISLRIGTSSWENISCSNHVG